jgi:hypothetical protein
MGKGILEGTPKSSTAFLQCDVRPFVRLSVCVNVPRDEKAHTILTGVMFRFPESVPLGHYLHVSDKAVPRAQTTASLSE